MEKIKISHCFCEIPEEDLVRLVKLRYERQVPTIQLMSELDSEQDRKFLATIALLDVSAEDIPAICVAESPSVFRHLLSCRQRARQILRELDLDQKLSA